MPVESFNYDAKVKPLKIEVALLWDYFANIESIALANGIMGMEIRQISKMFFNYFKPQDQCVKYKGNYSYLIQA